MTDQLFFYHLYDYKIELNDERISSRSHLYHMSTSYSRSSSRSMTLSSTSTTIVLARRFVIDLFDHFVTRLEFLLDVLELDTFYDGNSRVDSGDFNAFKIMKKDAGLTAQMRSGILTVLRARSLSCHHLPPLGSISAR